MKRLKICVWLMAGIILLSSVSLVVTKKSNDRLFSLIDEVNQSYESGENVQEAIGELEEYWVKYYIRISYIAKTDHLNEISSSVGRLRFLYENDSDEFSSELETIKVRVKIIYSSQVPRLYSVF